MGDVEVTRGVVISYDDDCPGVYISDAQGEVCCWIFDEIIEDPAAWTASLHAVAMAAAMGPEAVRAWIARRGFSGPEPTSN